MSDRGYTVRVRGVQSAPREYLCDEHGPFELVVDLATSATPRPCPECAAPCERTIEANIVARAALVSFTRGKADEAPPYATTTEALADGMPYSEWKAGRKKLWHDKDWKDAKSKGLLP